MIWYYNSKNLFENLSYKNFIFLAGPTDRKCLYSWRKKFLKLFTNKDKYDIFIPEYKSLINTIRWF